MINNNIFNIFCFLTFSFGYFLDLVFRAFFSKFGQNTGFVKYPKEKVEKQKMLKMLLLVICEVPKKISTIFKPFLAIFTLFHLKNWPYLQKPEFGNLAKTRFWFLLVNNSLCSIPLSYARSYIKETPGERCVLPIFPGSEAEDGFLFLKCSQCHMFKRFEYHHNLSENCCS